MQVYIVQAFCSFIFVLAYANVPKKSLSNDGIVQAICIALVFFGLTHIGEMAGASFNPVLSASSIFFEKFASKDTEVTANMYTYSYLIGPFIGAFISAAFNCVINCAEDFLSEDD